MIKEKSPTISIATIIKNEEKQMESFLSHIVDFADEIIIIDTNSSDKSLDIIKKFINEGRDNIKLYEYKLAGSFHYGKAKNFSIEKATKDYVIVLDADERLSNEFKAGIVGFLEKEKPIVASIKRVALTPIS